MRMSDRCVFTNSRVGSELYCNGATQVGQDARPPTVRRRGVLPQNGLTPYRLATSSANTASKGSVPHLRTKPRRGEEP